MVFTGLLFDLQMPDNTRLQPTVPAIDPILPATDLLPGECVRGNVTFEVPQEATPDHVVFEKMSGETAKWAIR